MESFEALFATGGVRRHQRQAGVGAGSGFKVHLLGFRWFRVCQSGLGFKL